MLRLLSSAQLCARAVILSLRLSSATIQQAMDNRTCFWHQGDFRLLCSCVLASSLFHTTVSKVFGQGTDRNGRVIYCKTHSLFAQLKPLIFLFLLLSDKSPSWVGWPVGCGGKECHDLCQNNRKYLAEYFAYQRRCSVTTMLRVKSWDLVKISRWDLKN